MSTNQSEQLSAACRWTSRLAVFSVVLLATAAALHQLGLPTPIAYNLVIMAYAGAFAALALAGVGTATIWRLGSAGASRVVVGTFLSLLMFAGAAVAAVLAAGHPAINDISTDAQAPPPFTQLAKMRTSSSNSPSYPTAFAPIQAQHYPDLVPLAVGRSADEAREIAVKVLQRLHYTIVQDAPAGIIEAFDRSMLLGFYDDVAVRVTGNDVRARIDIRSASRFGIYDFGHNAGRVRTLLKEIVARLEETVPSADGERIGVPGKPAKTGVKPEKERGSKKAIPRKPPDRE